MAERTVKVTVLPSDLGRMASGGSQSFEVHVDGERVGYVYDARPWKGYRFGAVRWCATRRNETDGAARWSREGYTSQRAAVRALVEDIPGGAP